MPGPRAVPGGCISSYERDFDLRGGILNVFRTFDVLGLGGSFLRFATRSGGGVRARFLPPAGGLSLATDGSRPALLAGASLIVWGYSTPNSGSSLYRVNQVLPRSSDSFGL